MRTLAVIIGVLLSALTLGACASLPRFVPASTCHVDGRTLRFVGPTDGQLVECLRLAKSVDSVEITSQGGSVRNAIEASRSLRALGAELVIKDYCESSCANYLIPAASRVRVAAGARVVLHGSVDAWAIDRGAPADLYNLQRNFAAEMGATPGWLLMRTADEGRSGSHGTFVIADPSETHAAGARYIVVEPAFIAACLPTLAVKWDEPYYLDQIRASDDRRRQLREQGFVFSGSMQCTLDQQYPPEP